MTGTCRLTPLIISSGGLPPQETIISGAPMDDPEYDVTRFSSGESLQVAGGNQVIDNDLWPKECSKARVRGHFSFKNLLHIVEFIGLVGLVFLFLRWLYARSLLFSIGFWMSLPLFARYSSIFAAASVCAFLTIWQRRV